MGARYPQKTGVLSFVVVIVFHSSDTTNWTLKFSPVPSGWNILQDLEKCWVSQEYKRDLWKNTWT